jgi:hypothetical protein
LAPLLREFNKSTSDCESNVEAKAFALTALIILLLIRAAVFASADGNFDF